MEETESEVLCFIRNRECWKDGEYPFDEKEKTKTRKRLKIKRRKNKTNENTNNKP